jgi:hypothetical protein
MIQKALYIKDYQIEVYFNDGKNRIIDLFNFLSASNHPLINKYLNLDLFQQFHIEMGTICWGDNDFDLNPMNIYNGKYDADLGRSKNKDSSSHIKIRETTKDRTPKAPNNTRLKKKV